jgi:DNA-nicking Smr family endonuclease
MSRKPQDFDLWLEMAKSIKPLRHRASRSAPGPAGKPLAAPVMLKKPLVSVAVPHVQRLSAHLKPAPPPHITGLDRRTSQRLTRGNVEVERRLDLHGTGIEVARSRLLQFLREAQQMGFRTVLVITGKGDSPFSRHTLHGSDHFHSPERAGRLRRMVPEWLHEPEFRTCVSGFQPAHPKHGGGGAYYVRIRRIRDEK